jgi:hypothetical protein
MAVTGTGDTNRSTMRFPSIFAVVMRKKCGHPVVGWPRDSSKNQLQKTNCLKTNFRKTKFRNLESQLQAKLELPR